MPNESAKSKELRTKNRKTKIDYRNEIQPAARPPARFLTEALDAQLSGGPVGVRKAQRVALSTARRFMERLISEWDKPTDDLPAVVGIPATVVDLTDAHRARLRYARHWRARFLAALSCTHSPTIAANYARIPRSVAYDHRERDRAFAGHWRAACDHAADLLEARCFQRALEGDLEAVYYMGVPVDYVRRFDGRLQVEMLRALRPDRFKTAGVNVNLAARGDVFVLTEDQRHELQRINRERIESERVALPAAGGSG
jgi:hypothetical protein